MPISKVGNSRRTVGFTLVETLISIVILAAIVTLVAPSFARTYQNSLLKTTARSLAATLRFTRASAISLNRSRSVQLDPQRKYFVLDTSTKIDIPESIEVKPNDSRHQPVADNLQITFYPHGGSNGGGLVLHNRRKSLLVEVNPVTGKVNVSEHASD